MGEFQRGQWGFGTVAMAIAMAWSIVSAPAFADAAGDITAGITAKAGAPTDLTQASQGRGREEKANNSKNQSNTGAIVAAVAGAALVAAATPKLASLIPSEVAIGAALMAKAGLEFAQSAASAKTGSENGGQYKQLTLAYDESQSNVNAQNPAQMQQQIAQSIANNADLQNVLQQRGVDPAQFAADLASGQMQSTESVLSAVKNTTPIDPNTLAQAEQVATAQTQLAVGDALSKVGIQEGAQTSGLAAAPAEGASNGGGTTMMAQGGGAGGKGNENSSATPGANAEAQAAKGNRSPASTAVSGPRDGAGKTNASGGFAGMAAIDDELLNQLMSNFPGAAKKKEETAVGDKERDPLMALGVRRPVGNMTLFQLAHRNFRSYREWRRKKMFAETGKTNSPRLALKAPPEQR